MADTISLIGTDAPPLITLAATGSLDYLLLVGLPIIIPDVVFIEATTSGEKLGAEAIIEWYRSHRDRVRIEPTMILKDEYYLAGRLERARGRDLGERSAFEIIRHLGVLREDERALLLSDDRDVERMQAKQPARLVLMTTWDFLSGLERAQRIQSADAVLEAARERGRNVPKWSLWSNHDPEIADQVAAILGLPRDA